MNKEKKVLYIVFACTFFLLSVALLIWSIKTSGVEESLFLLTLLAIAAITSAILFFSNIRGKDD